MKKKEPWRIIVGAIAIVYIIFLWVKKDIASAFGTIPAEQLLPLIITSVLVTGVKILGITAAVLLIKWLINKIKTGL